MQYISENYFLLEQAARSYLRFRFGFLFNELMPDVVHLPIFIAQFLLLNTLDQDSRFAVVVAADAFAVLLPLDIETVAATAAVIPASSFVPSTLPSFFFNAGNAEWYFFVRSSIEQGATTRG